MISILLKESFAILPIILVAYIVFKDGRILLKSIFRIEFIPYSLVMLIYLYIKSNEISPLTLPDTHPYKISFWGKHLVQNIYLYGKWSLQAIFPYPFSLSVWGAGLLMLALLFVLLVLMETFLKNGFRKGESGWNLSFPLFLASWFIIGLLPLVFLPNHSYRYYLTVSLPPFLTGFLLLLDSFIKHNRLSRFRESIVIFIVGFSLLGSAYVSYSLHREGLLQRTLYDGTNMLIRRTATVRIVRRDLLNHRGSFPPDSVLIFKNVDLWSFSKDSEPRVWYKDNTLRVYDIENLDMDHEGIYIGDAPETQGEAYVGAKSERMKLDRSKVFVYALEKSHLLPVPLDEIERLKGCL